MFFKRFLLTIASSAFLLNAETDFRFAFPQSEILLGVDVKWLLKSPFGASMKKELKGNLGDLKALEPLMDQIDSIHLSAVSMPITSAAPIAQAGTRSPYRPGEHA